MNNEGNIPKPSDACPCSGGWGTSTITPNGDMVICTSLHWVLGNVTKCSISSILQSESLKEWRNINIGDIEGCGTKPECDYCNLCSGKNYSEHRVLTKPSNVNCWIADVRYGLMQKLKRGEGPLHGLSVTERLAQMEDNKVEKFGKEIVEH